MGRIADDAPAEWGRTTVLEIDVDGELSDWYEIVLPGVDGTIHHGHRSGSTMPDTVAVGSGEGPVALADAFAYHLDNQYCYDSEYYLVLRVRQVLQPHAWQRLPWAALGPGDVFVAWDKFHGITYSREPGGVSEMSYGGDWNDLQLLVDTDHPLPGRTPVRGPVSDASVLRAVRNRDAPLLRALLAAGGNPDAGLHVPISATRSVSVDRDSYALLDAVNAGDPDLVEALLTAGATVDGPPGTTWTPLRAALHRPPSDSIATIARLLLRHDANPDAGRSNDLAGAPPAFASPEIAGLFESSWRSLTSVWRPGRWRWPGR